MTTLDHHAVTFTRPHVPGLRALIVLWVRRHRTRRHLRELENHRLADIGLSPDERRRECAKWFWHA
jgi:uncharacterized protein YjiS (DUF1127 family)